MADYMSVKEAAEKLDVSTAKVRALIQKGELEGAFQNPNRAWVIPAEAVTAYQARQRKTISGKTVKSKPRSSNRKKSETSKPKKKKTSSSGKPRRKKTPDGIDLQNLVEALVNYLLNSKKGAAKDSPLAALLAQVQAAGVQEAVGDPLTLEALLTQVVQANPDLIEGILQGARTQELKSESEETIP